ncbi:MAG: cysteine--tRNA ligase [Candidatus Methanoperedens sp.]|nr:cysteine--tRNA ligase [Candidatus Methanoperedens sp.]MCZ7369340.1 cysteine--tRNA ligase [Candidatus Methanoperedens sp.]
MLKLFNTFTRRREKFEPLGDIVGIYTCGPSVYQYAHIGNFRTFIFEDVLVRYLRFKGFRVKRVMNLTDIEDKALTTARKEGKSLKELTEFYSKVFFEDMKTLNLLPADVFPRATEHVPEIIKIIKKLMENGYAYCGTDGSIYYDVSKFKGWGKLSHLKLKPGKKKIKRDEWGEESAIISDFALWKSYEKEDGDVFWETELGKGRPGWHIECSAMCSRHLGTRFDLHIGGVDNIFPHHENVIAQNFGAFGENPSRYWLHCRHLMVDGKKMSKSAGNFFTTRDLLDKGYKPMAIKYHLLSMNYRRRLNFTFQGLEEAGKKLERIQSIIERLKTAEGTEDAEKIARRAGKKFEQSLDDNLNTGKALKILEEFTEEIGTINPDKRSLEKILETFKTMDSILGLDLFKPS